MNANDELAEIERITDWSALVDSALDVPPRPSGLFWALNRWFLLFHVVERGSPEEADYPDAVRFFFERLAFADYPPDLWDWRVAFKKKRGRAPRASEIPRHLRCLVPTSKRGRPRLDTVRFRKARRAWEILTYRNSYETRRDIMAFMRGCPGVSSCFGLSQASLTGDSPSNLAIDLLSQEARVSVSSLDKMRVRSRKK